MFPLACGLSFTFSPFSSIHLTLFSLSFSFFPFLALSSPSSQNRVKNKKQKRVFNSWKKGLLSRRAWERGGSRGKGVKDQRGETSRNSCSVSAPKARLLVDREKAERYLTISLKRYKHSHLIAMYSRCDPTTLKKKPCVLDGTACYTKEGS